MREIIEKVRDRDNRESERDIETIEKVSERDNRESER